MHEQHAYRDALEQFHAEHAAARVQAKAAYDEIIEPARTRYRELVVAARQARDAAPGTAAEAVFNEVVDHADSILRDAHNRGMAAHNAIVHPVEARHQQKVDAARAAFRESLDPPAKQA